MVGFLLLSKIFVLDEVLICIVLVLAAHSPDECVCFGTASGMDGPAWVDDSFLVVHDDVSCLLWLAHVVHNKCIVIYIEVHVNFHTSVMCMSRHGVPYASWEEFCKSHGDLSGIYLACYDIFVDYSVVGLLKRSALYFVLVFYDHNVFRCLTFQFDKNGRILFVCRCTVEI